MRSTYALHLWPQLLKFFELKTGSEFSLIPLRNSKIT